MPPIGFIKVQAVTSQAEIPVEGATVTITGTGANGMQALLSLQRTDESGQTDAVSVNTPQLSNSLSPNQPQGWTNVRVAISHPNYDGIVVNTVQIFPGITTQQEMVLIPRGALPSDLGQTEEFTVPSQGL